MKQFAIHSPDFQVLNQISIKAANVGWTYQSDLVPFTESNVNLTASLRFWESPLGNFFMLSKPDPDFPVYDAASLNGELEGLLKIEKKELPATSSESIQKTLEDKRKGERFKHEKQSDNLRAYWDKVCNSHQGRKFELSEVVDCFKSTIRTFESVKGVTWNTAPIRSQMNQIVYHLAKLVNGETDKSLFLMGERGVGKSTLLKSFYLPTYWKLKKGNIPSVVQSVDIIFKESDLIGTSLNHCLIDDLGTEIHHIRPVTATWTPGKEEIANQVYYILDKRRSGNKITHVTTNLGMPELTAIYGNRITWRFDEMFEFVKF